MKSNLEIAKSIAESVYDMTDSDSFYGHLISEHGIKDKFTEKVLSNEDYKSVMIHLMIADILSDIVEDPISFKNKHANEDGFVGYHPDDRDYDFRMTDYVVGMFQDISTRRKIMEYTQETLPKKKFKITGRFSYLGHEVIEATSQEEAMKLANEHNCFEPDDSTCGWEVLEAKEL